jgi:3-hydroxybutyryl-CoA dehydrogenase
MKIAVYAKDGQWKELKNVEGVEFVEVPNAVSLFEVENADAYFNFESSEHLINTSEAPYFVNSVVEPLYELGAGSNATRFNGWPGFFEKNTWEISGELSHQALAILKTLNKEVIKVTDHPGFISARILSMIINEAYYAAGESVGTKEEIDIAMKLGTNYPYGPFEWAEMIGIHNIYNLLTRLSVTDDRYQPSPLLTKQVNS